MIAGRPSMGKSALAGNIALRAALAGNRAGVLSLEMAAGSFVRRWLADLSGIEATRLRDGTLEAWHWPLLTEACDRLAALAVHIDDTPGLSDLEVRRRVRALHRRHPDLAIVVVDYLQLLEGERADERHSREESVAAASRRIKALARELSIHVLLVAQLNRKVEDRLSKRPNLGDLRESGAIEMDADRVLFIYRDDYYHPDSPKRGVAELIVAKQREGGTGTVEVAWTPHALRFGAKAG